jgi:hypothetical protein
VSNIYLKMKEKMKCRETENNLIGYIEKTLTADQMQDMALHLKECNTCNILFDEVKTTYTSFGALPEPSLNPFFYTRVAAKLHNKKHIADFIPKYTVFTKIASSVLIIVGIGIGIYLGGEMQIPAASLSSSAQTEMLEAYTSEYNLDDSGFQVLESLITNE